MDFLAVIIAFAIQRLLHFAPTERLPKWIHAYFVLMEKQTEKYSLVKKQAWMSVAFLLLPIFIIVAVVLFLLAHTLSDVSNFFLYILIMWYCVDSLRFKRLKEEGSPDVIFMTAYEDIFAIIFWYAILGPFGGILYYLVTALLEYLNEAAIKKTNWLTAVLKFRGLLDWIPVRLVGLTFALVGHFFFAASDWFHHLKGGLAPDHQLVAELGDKAMKLDAGEKDKRLERALYLAERALWLWLVVLAIGSIFSWLG